MKTWLAGIMLFAALSAGAHAEIVAGTVVDRTNRPIPNAIVTVTLASGARPLQTRSDADGRFTVETSETPASVTLQQNGFDPQTMHLAAVAPSVMAELRIELMYKLVTIERYGARSACRAYQPYQPWDVYVVIPGGTCGAPKR